MKTAKTNGHQQSKYLCTLHNLLLPELPEKIRRWVNATYAAHGGAEHMSLDEWRDLEQELNRRTQNESGVHLPG